MILTHALDRGSEKAIPAVMTRLATILVPVDGSALAEQAIPVAAALARRHASQLELAIVHSPTPHDALPDAPWNAMSQSMQNRYAADRAAALTSMDDGVVARSVLLRGDPAEQIARRARQIGADLIVMATHGRTGFDRAINGSVADTVIRESGVPVLLVREPAQPRAARPHVSTLLILTDGSPESRSIVDAAIAVATPGETTIRLLQIVSPVRSIPDPSLPYGYLERADDAATAALVGQARSTLETLTSTITARSGCVVDPQLIMGQQVDAAIVGFIACHRVDLIAMATHGRGASRLIFRSVADAVQRATDLPMLILKPSPLTPTTP